MTKAISGMIQVAMIKYLIREITGSNCGASCWIIFGSWTDRHWLRQRGRKVKRDSGIDLLLKSDTKSVLSLPQKLLELGDLAFLTACQGSVIDNSIAKILNLSVLGHRTLKAGCVISGGVSDGATFFNTNTVSPNCTVGQSTFKLYDCLKVRSAINQDKN